MTQAQPQLDEVIRTWIVDLLRSRPDVTALVARSRAKFEGWLKIELAAWIRANGGKRVTLEAGYTGNSCRADIRFAYSDHSVQLELKTPNTNYRMPGARDKARPITKNVASIVEDARKLRACGGYVAFALFPIPCGDHRWREYLHRIGDQLEVELSEKRHCRRVTVQLKKDCSCEIVVCCFPVGLQAQNNGDTEGQTREDVR